jgi:acyl carrier protein
MAAMRVYDRLFALLDRDFNVDLTGIDPARSIFEQIPIDSMVLVGIAAGIEQEFGVELPLSFMEHPTLDNLLRLIPGGTCPSEGNAGFAG